MVIRGDSMSLSYSNENFSFWRSESDIVLGEDRKENQMLHNHAESGQVEILVYLQGDSSFYVEGASHPLKPMDIVFARPGEMHRVVHHSNCHYERAIITVFPSFFQMPGCSRFADIFINRSPGKGNFISHLSPEGRLLFDSYRKIESYLFGAEQIPLLAQNTLMEFLYLLNSIKPEPVKSATPSSIRKVVLYIHEHITEDISLDSIAAHFFMSKHYLCRVFKQHTGHTVNQYITWNRITLARDLRLSGMTLSDAAAAAGFRSYSSYYRAYRKATSNRPKDIRPSPSRPNKHLSR